MIVCFTGAQAPGTTTKATPPDSAPPSPSAARATAPPVGFAATADDTAETETETTGAEAL